MFACGLSAVQILTHLYFPRYSKKVTAHCKACNVLWFSKHSHDPFILKRSCFSCNVWFICSHFNALKLPLWVYVSVCLWALTFKLQKCSDAMFRLRTLWYSSRCVWVHACAYGCVCEAQPSCDNGALFNNKLTNQPCLATHCFSQMSPAKNTNASLLTASHEPCCAHIQWCQAT